MKANNVLVFVQELEDVFKKELNGGNDIGNWRVDINILIIEIDVVLD